MKSGGTEKVHAIGAAVLAAAAVASWVGILQPTLHARAAYAGLVKELQTERGALQAAEEGEKAERVEAEAASASLAARPLMLEPASAVNERLQAVGELAGGCGVRIDTLEAGRMEGFGAYGVLLVQATGRGTFEGIGKFLARLHEKLPDMEVVSAELSGKFNDDMGGQSVSVKLRWHTQDAGGAGADGGAAR